MRLCLVPRAIAGGALATLVALASPAHAQTVDSAHRAANVGYIMGVAGPPVATVGVLGLALGAAAAWDGNDSGGAVALGGLALTGVGAAGILVGPPLQAGGAVAGARRAAAQGADITPELGYWAWGLWGGTMLSGSLANAITNQLEGEARQAAGPIQTGGSVVGLGCYVGSLVVGRKQTRRTEAAMATTRAPTSQRPSTRPRLQLSLIPQRDGIRLAGTF